MAKYSYDRGTYWDVQFWLIFDAWGGVRMTRGEPDLKTGERAMFMNSAIPHKLFNVPQLTANISVPDIASAPIHIDAAAVSEAIKAVVGTDVNITVNYPFTQDVEVEDA